MAGDDGFVERMFPEPVDHGIGQPDRAVSNVQSGTDTPAEKAGNTKWHQGGGRVGGRAHQDSVVYPPPGRRVAPPGRETHPSRSRSASSSTWMWASWCRIGSTRPSWPSRTRSTKASTTGRYGSGGV